MSVAAFVRKLLCWLRADGHQTWQGGPYGARKKSGDVRFHGNPFVAMEIRKFSHSEDIGSRMTLFSMQDHLGNTYLLAKNQQILPNSY